MMLVSSISIECPEWDLAPLSYNPLNQLIIFACQLTGNFLINSPQDNTPSKDCNETRSALAIETAFLRCQMKRDIAYQSSD